MRGKLLICTLAIGAFGVTAFAEEEPSSADEARRAKVFATVGSETITVGDLEDLINARSPYARQRLADPELLKELGDDQVRNELFYQGAQKLGYAEDPEVMAFVDQTLVQLFVRKEFEEAVTPADIPEEQVAKYYEEHAEDFRRPAMRRARHILVGSKKEAQTILGKLKSGEATFRALAKEQSLDTETKLRGGDLLYFTEDGKLVGNEDAEPINATLVKAAFSLEKTGERSKPLDLGDGKWSVLELTGIRPENVQTLEQASESIRRKLWREDREAALRKLMTDLRTELEPEIHPERLDAIVLEPAKAPVEPPNQ
ncbi:MAG TPA: peptidyl-prolyl cis-trans isomerase [Polyangiales bacterium]|nr:peptidyl-prolyl cis-trans isomerase [Polyangiales bacterium]